MIHLIFALKTEALSLINSYQLKKIKNLPFTLYANTEIKLLITQMGLDNAKENSIKYFNHYHPQENDILINIGICAAQKRHKLADILFINNVQNSSYHINLTPIKYKEYKTSSLMSFDTIQTQERDGCADMEAYSVVSSALDFFKKENIFVIKIVSDHFEPHTISKEGVLKMMQEQNSELKEIIKEIQCQQQ